MRTTREPRKRRRTNRAIDYELQKTTPRWKSALDGTAVEAVDVIPLVSQPRGLEIKALVNAMEKRI
jgi:hypothetical protein